MQSTETTSFEFEPGLYSVTFSGGGQPSKIRIVQYLTGLDTFVAFIDDEGNIYNWQNIIKMIRIPE